MAWMPRKLCVGPGILTDLEAQDQHVHFDAGSNVGLAPQPGTAVIGAWAVAPCIVSVHRSNVWQPSVHAGRHLDRSLACGSYRWSAQMRQRQISRLLSALSLQAACALLDMCRPACMCVKIPHRSRRQTE